MRTWFIALVLSFPFLVMFQPTNASAQDRMNAALTDAEKLVRAKAFAFAVVNACDLGAPKKQKITIKLDESMARIGEGFEPNDYGNFHWFEFSVSAGTNFTNTLLKPFLKEFPKLGDSVETLIAGKDFAVKRAMANWFVACVENRLVLSDHERKQLAELVADRCFTNSTHRLISVTSTTSVGIERILITEKFSNETFGDVFGSHRQKLWERLFDNLDEPESTVIDHNDSDAEWKRMIVVGAEKANASAMEQMKLQIYLQSKIVGQPKGKYAAFEEQMASAMKQVSQAYITRHLEGFTKMTHVPDTKSTIFHPTFSSWYSLHPTFRDALKANLFSDELGRFKEWNLDRKKFVKDSAVELVVAAIDCELMLSNEQRIKFAKVVRDYLPRDLHLEIADDFREFRLIGETIRDIPNQTLPELSELQLNSWNSFRRQMKSSGQLIAICLGQPTVCQVWTGPPVRKPSVSKEK